MIASMRLRRAMSAHGALFLLAFFNRLAPAIGPACRADDGVLWCFRACHPAFRHQADLIR